MFLRSTLFVFLLLTLASCSHFQKFAVGSSSGIVYSSSFEMETETRFENLEQGLLPNLKTVEGLLFVDPTNTDLLATLTKGYSAYSVGVLETKLLEDRYAKKSEEADLASSLASHSKAVAYGFRFLKARGIEYEALSASLTEKLGITEILDAQLREGQKDRETLLYLAMSLASLINLQKTNYELMSQLPLITQMMDWVCKKEPLLANGSCDLFYGSLYASRPKAYGGDPEKAKGHFLAALKNFPENDFARMLYIQSFLIPTLDEKTYGEEMKKIEEAQKKFAANELWLPLKKEESEVEKRLHLYKAIAYKRYQILKKYEKELF